MSNLLVWLLEAHVHVSVWGRREIASLHFSSSEIFPILRFHFYFSFPLKDNPPLCQRRGNSPGHTPLLFTMCPSPLFVNCSADSLHVQMGAFGKMRGFLTCCGQLLSASRRRYKIYHLLSASSKQHLAGGNEKGKHLHIPGSGDW